MPVMQLYQHGTTMGIPPGPRKAKPAKRGEVGGWSSGSVRSNVAFLRSVVDCDLTGTGFAFTLTVRDCPATHEDWHRVRRAFLKRLAREGILRAHWVVEWQRRGVPHLHGMVYFAPAYSRTPQARRKRVASIIRHWSEAAADYGPGALGQHVQQITDALGWRQYLAKHAARGVRHYQRSPDKIPQGWHGRTGRMWGHCGIWPVNEPIRMELDRPGFYAMRRMMRNWRIADARLERDQSRRAGRIISARGMLRSPDRALSELRGVSEWVPIDVQISMLHALHARGMTVRQQ